MNHKIILIILGAWLLIACTELALKSPPISLGVPLSALSSIIWIAEEMDYFKEQGLDINITTYPSGKEALVGLLAGEVDLVATAETPFAVALFKHDSLRLFATIGASRNEVHILARRDRGINKPKDLIGKRIATQKGSAVHFFLSSFLLHHQIDPESLDLRFMKVDELPIALINGDIDAFSMREPHLTQVIERLGVDKIVKFSVPGLYTKTYNLVGDKTFTRKHPGMMERILLALNQSIIYADANPDQAIILVAKRFSLSIDHISKLWPDLHLMVTLNQGLLNTLEEESRWVISSGQVKWSDTLDGTVPNILKFIDPKPLKKAIPQAVGLIGFKAHE